MTEGVRIDRIEDLKPGDVLVLPSANAAKVLESIPCLPVDHEMILFRNSSGDLLIPCGCDEYDDGVSMVFLWSTGLLEFFTLKSRSGSEVCPGDTWLGHGPKIDRAFTDFSGKMGKPSASEQAVASPWWRNQTLPGVTLADLKAGNQALADKISKAFGAPTWFPEPSETDWAGTDGLGADDHDEEGFPIGTRYATFGATDLALLPDGVLYAAHINGDEWEEIEFIPCGAQANNTETPIALERDIPEENPIALDRDIPQEPPISRDRIDFLALNKEFSSK